MKECFRKMISFLAIVCCLAGMVLPLPVQAAEEAPRVVFENIQNETPTLYVSKEVKVPDGTYELPENLRFTFILRWTENWRTGWNTGCLMRAAQRCITTRAGNPRRIRQTRFRSARTGQEPLPWQSVRPPCLRMWERALHMR